MNKTYSKRALIVDDNPDAARILGMILELTGFRVSIEKHPTDALTMAESERFDIFVLDIGLPEFDGYELARLLLARPQCAGALFVALTGHETEEYKEKSIAAGFHHHLIKPATIPKVLGVLKPPKVTN